MPANLKQHLTLAKAIFSTFAIYITLSMLPVQHSYAENKPESEPESKKGTKLELEQGTMLEKGTILEKATVLNNRAILAPCPKKPNCVNSQITDDKKRYIKPLKTTDVDVEKNRNNLLEVINKFPRVKVVVSDEDFVKAEFTSKWFRFVDDVEFVIGASHIDVRSASRKGYSDLGANRRRVEKIRRLLHAN
jgi:uncharacterized protein (DUF1499 family)